MTAAAASKLVFTTSPVTVAAGVASSTITVQRQDAAGNPNTTDAARTVTLSSNSTGTVTFNPASPLTIPNGSSSVSFTYTDTQAGTPTITAASTSPTTITSAAQTETVTAAAASKLVFTTSPVTVAAGVASGTITVQRQDASGNPNTTDAARTVTLSSNSTGTVTFNPASPLTIPNGSSSVSFTYTDTKAGTPTITAASTSPTTITSAAQTETVTAAAASKLAYTTVPSTGTAGTAFSVTVQSQDANGNPSSPTSNTTITLSKATGGGTLTGVLTGTILTTGNSVTITTPVYSKADTMTLTATATAGMTSLGSVTSGNIVFSGGTATQLAFTTQPGNATAGSVFGTQPVVVTQDSFGNNSSAGLGNNMMVTVTIASGTGTLLGTATLNIGANGGNGTVTFTNLEIDAAGSKTLQVAKTGGTGTLASATSNAFTVSAATATKLVFTTQPGGATAGAAFTTQPVVASQDNFGNNSTIGLPASLVLTVNLQTGTGTLLGTATKNIGTGGGSPGVATFTDLEIDTTGAKTLRATVAGGVLTQVDSNSFTVNPGAPTHLVYLQQPTTAQAGVSIAPPVTVQVEDANNNVVTTGTGSTASVGIAILANPGGGTLSGTTPVNAVAGIATFSNLSINKTGTGYTLQATSSGLTSVTSSTFNITAAGANKLAFLQQPTDTTVAVTMTPALTVQIQDQFGNVTTIGTDATRTVSLGIGTNPSSGTLTGGGGVPAVAGVATFSGVSIDKAGTGYTLAATSTGLANPSITSSTFTINNPVPTLATIAPDNGNLSDTLDVVFHGTNYISGVSSVSFGPNITVTTTVNSSIQITAHITIQPGAAVGARNVSVTNSAPGGGTATLTNGFTVNNPATTTSVTSSSPLNTSTYGDSVTFTATVSSSSTPTGSVNFVIDGGSPVAGTAGATTSTTATWTYTTSALNATNGTPHTVSASYAHSGSFQDSSGSLFGGQVVNKANATWTTNPNSKTYGVADPVPLTTGSGTGFLFSDGVTATYSRDPGETASPPTYHISATLSPAGVLSNYNITNAGAEFTINKKDATWTTNPASKTYGDPDPVGLTTGSGTGFLVADGVTATYSRVAGESASPPTYHITATLSAAAGVLANYIITNDGAEFTIDKRLATWTTNPASKTYGDTDPVGLTTGSGSNFTDPVTATYSRVAGESASPPTYHITATLSAAAGVLANYIITNDGAEFTIDKRLATWTTNPASKTYGSPDPVPLTTGSGSNFVPADNVTATYSRASGETVLAGPYHITATLSATPPSALDNYIITNAGASFTINPKDLDVTANNRMKTYGVTVTFAGTEFTVEMGQLVTGDSVTSVTLTSAGAAATATFTAPGPDYNIVPSAAVGTGLDNYAIHYHYGTLHVNQAALTITATNVTKTYGNTYAPDTTTPSTDFGVSGLVNSDTVSSIMLASTGYSATATYTSPGPDYTIAPSAAAGTGLGNYIIGYTPATLTITQASLAVAANNVSKVYGVTYTFDTTTPSTDFSVTGLKNSDTVGSVTLSSTGAAAAATFVSPGPTYSITVGSASGTGLGNYIISYTPATLTITQATLTITATNRSKVFAATYTPDTTPPSPDLNISGLVNTDTVTNVTLTCAGYAAAALPQPTPYTVTPSAAVGTGLGSYTIGYVTGTLTIGYGLCGGSPPTILQPINADGSSVVKQGSTVPVKFSVCDANGNPISNPMAVFGNSTGSITLLSAVRGTVDNVNEQTTNDIPDVAFRYSSGIWIFNMATNNLVKNTTYHYRIPLADGSFILFQFGTK